MEAISLFDFSLSSTWKNGALITKRLGLLNMYKQFLTLLIMNIHGLLNTPMHESQSGKPCAFNIIWLIEKRHTTVRWQRRQTWSVETFNLMVSFSSLCSPIYFNPKCAYKSRKYSLQWFQQIIRHRRRASIFNNILHVNFAYWIKYLSGYENIKGLLSVK